MTENDIKRFWSRINKGLSDECWPWTAYTHKGYGYINVGGTLYRTHRIAYYLATGADPGDNSICHSCDNPPCCNGAHLFSGSQAANLADMREKDRGAGPLGRHLNQGEAHGMAKFTTEHVIEIREMVASGVGQRETARRFSAKHFPITHGAVGLIVNRKRWAHLP